MASKRMRDTHFRCLIINNCLNSLLISMILLGHSWNFLMDSLSNLMKCNSWCMSGYARSQRNFFIRNTSIIKVLGPHNISKVLGTHNISKVLGPHNTTWTMLKNDRAVPSISPQNQSVKNLQVFHLTHLCV